MGTKITAWRANDGHVCETEDEMNAYEQAQADEMAMQTWLDTKEPWPRGQRTRAEAILRAYLGLAGDLFSPLKPTDE